MFRMPGTNLEMSANACEATLGSLFSADGLRLSQVCTITGLEPHSVHNWTKRGLVAAARDKKYTRAQFCRIALLNVTHEVLPLPVAAAALEGIDNELVYGLFCDVVFAVEVDGVTVEAALAAACNGVAAGLAARVQAVLRMLWAAYVSAREKATALRWAGA